MRQVCAESDASLPRSLRSRPRPQDFLDEENKKIKCEDILLVLLKGEEATRLLREQGIVKEPQSRRARLVRTTRMGSLLAKVTWALAALATVAPAAATTPSAQGNAPAAASPPRMLTQHRTGWTTADDALLGRLKEGRNSWRAIHLEMPFVINELVLEARWRLAIRNNYHYYEPMRAWAAGEEEPAPPFWAPTLSAAGPALLPAPPLPPPSRATAARRRRRPRRIPRGGGSRRRSSTRRSWSR